MTTLNIGSPIAVRVPVPDEASDALSYFENPPKQKLQTDTILIDNEPHTFQWILTSPQPDLFCQWRAALPQAGRYQVAVFVPRVHGTTTQARYAVHGIQGQAGPVDVTINQEVQFDAWVPLGTWDFDPASTPEIRVEAQNHSEEDPPREMAFDEVRWLLIPPDRPMPRPKTKLLVGLHDLEGGQWMKSHGLPGVCLALVQVQDQPVALDFSDLAAAGLTLLLRIHYGTADGTGTLPPPERLAAFEQAVAATLNGAKGVTATHYGNEINNPSEHPGWDPSPPGQRGPNYFALTPQYYIDSYNRVWQAIRTDVKLGPAPLDPYFGPGSNNRDWWQAILSGITGADALFLHSKTQTNDPAEVRSRVKFGNDPLKWQYLHFRTLETSLEIVPERFKSLPVYISEANPQIIGPGKLGWQKNHTAWLQECISYLEEWNATPGSQPVTGVTFYRWDFDDWRLLKMGAFLDTLVNEGQRLLQ